MATVTFKARPEKIYNMDDTLAYERIKVPALTRSHCDMPAFRKHPKFGGWANSDLFLGMLNKQVRALTGNHIRLGAAPAGVTLDSSGFLTAVTIEL